MDMVHAANNGDSNESRDTLMMFGGLALVKLLQAAGPDFDRYMKLKSM